MRRSVAPEAPASAPRRHARGTAHPSTNALVPAGVPACGRRGVVPPLRTPDGNFRRRSRAGLLCLGLAIVAVIAPTGASAAPTATPPPQGMYENCDLPTHEEECLQRLDELHSAGIEVVIN